MSDLGNRDDCVRCFGGSGSDARRRGKPAVYASRSASFELPLELGHQLLQAHIESRADGENLAKADIPLAALDTTHVRSVQLAAVRKRFLRNA